jgi:hypothetical protein
MRDLIQCAILSVGIVTLMLVFKNQASQDNQQDNPEARVYCEMRKIFDDTNGDFGWPNYRDDIECIDGEVK